MTTSSDRPDTAAGQHPAVATACGKVILLGEHSVVYGEPAIAVPLSDMRLSVVLASPTVSWVPPGAKDSGLIKAPISPGSPQDDVSTLAMPSFGTPEFQEFADRVRAEGGVPAEPTLEAGEHPPLTIDVEAGAPEGARGDVSRALGTAAHELGLQMPLPVRVAVRAGGLRSGMGTSAALGTAVTRALLQWYGEDPTPERVMPVAAAVEQLFHSNPSGVDHTVSVHESPVWFEKEKPPVPLHGLPPLQLVLLPRTSGKSTAELVNGVRESIVADPQLVRVIAEMGRWCRDGHAAWRAGDLGGLGEAMNQQQRSLDRIGVVNDDDREGVSIALEAGALGAKITGAGWGGTLLALVEDRVAAGVAREWGPDAVRVRVG
ncbi:MAG: mevalonate kinase [Proteobacteria bacterium]|nr:mevalonate kinase [Pseudomonadota bacterium]